MNAPIEYVVFKISILKRALILLLPLLIVSVFLSRGFALGFLMGGLISLANFSLLSKYILEMKDLTIKKAQRFIILRFLGMYLIMAAVLVIGITKSLVTFFGVALGLFLVKIVIFLERLIKRDVAGNY